MAARSRPLFKTISESLQHGEAAAIVIDDPVERFKNDYSSQAKALAAELASVDRHLHPDETLLWAAPAWRSMRQGILAASDRRILFTSKLIGEKFIELPYERIDEVDSEHRTNDVLVSIISGESRISFAMAGSSAFQLVTIAKAERSKRGVQQAEPGSDRMRKTAGYPQPRWEWHGICRGNATETLKVVQQVLMATGVTFSSKGPEELVGSKKGSMLIGVFPTVVARLRKRVGETEIFIVVEANVANFSGGFWKERVSDSCHRRGTQEDA